jgi:hypothetical protein
MSDDVVPMYLESGQLVRVQQLAGFSFLVKESKKGSDSIPDALLGQAFVVDHNPYKINENIWQGILTLFFEQARIGQELVVLVFVRDSDHTQQKLILPRQEASMAVCSFDFKAESGVLDVLSGEYLDAFDLFAEYSCAWTIHSHHTMACYYPSGQDDLSELPHPGFYGIVSHINLAKSSYRACFSLVTKDGLSNSRKIFPEEENSKLVENFSPIKVASSESVFFDKRLVVAPKKPLYHRYLSKGEGSVGRLTDFLDWEDRYLENQMMEEYVFTLEEDKDSPNAYIDEELLNLEFYYGKEAFAKAIKRFLERSK